MLRFPTVDLAALRDGSAAQRLEIVRTLGKACRETGFFCVAAHGISAASKATLFQAARDFFSLPLEEKIALSIARSSHNRGYVGLQTERLNAGEAPDQKEAFNIGLELSADDVEVKEGRPLRGVNFWPDLPGWRQTMLAYYNQCLEIGRLLHRGFSIDLGLDEDYFDAKLAAPAAVLRLLRYPPRVPTVSALSSFGPTSEAPGAGEHTDYGNITLLATDGVAGLQVRQRDGLWLEVADTRDLLLCNIGDCLMRWTNDQYVSTPHRVRMPTTERYSIAFFLDPNPDAIVDPAMVVPNETPRYEPISVRDYLLSRLTSTYDHLNRAAMA
jgi:isopenicillin N synthase-like dioxygenase